MRTISILVLTAVACGAALGQQSASYRLEEQTVNAGGHPAQGVTLASPSHHVLLDAVGEGVVATGQTSASYILDSGFVAAYPPPGEVRGLAFQPDRQTMTWQPERAAGTYNLYRDLLSALPGLGYGACQASAITGTSASDPQLPNGGAGFFYLVTVRNRVREEGTKGWASSGALRANPAPCP
jgi:hypothetical protein